MRAGEVPYALLPIAGRAKHGHAPTRYLPPLYHPLRPGSGEAVSQALKQVPRVVVLSTHPVGLGSCARATLSALRDRVQLVPTLADAARVLTNGTRAAHILTTSRAVLCPGTVVVCNLIRYLPTPCGVVHDNTTRIHGRADGQPSAHHHRGRRRRYCVGGGPTLLMSTPPMKKGKASTARVRGTRITAEAVMPARRRQGQSQPSESWARESKQPTHDWPACATHVYGAVMCTWRAETLAGARSPV